MFNKTIPVTAKFSHILISCTIAALFAAGIQTEARISPFPPSIEKMAKSAHAVKAVVLEIELLKDEKQKKLAASWLIKGSGLDNDASAYWQICRAKLCIISDMNGAYSAGDTAYFIFRSNNEITPPAKPEPVSSKPMLKGWVNDGPEFYAHFNLERSKSYYLFGFNTSDPKTMRQISSEFTTNPAEGFFRASNETKPPIAKTEAAGKDAAVAIRKAIVDDLVSQTKSNNKTDVEYARETLKAITEAETH